MANTTQANVLAIASELSGIAAETWTTILADVAADVQSAVYGTNQEIAQRYLAAHYLTLINSSDPLRRPNAAGPVSSETAGQTSASFAAIPYRDRSRYDETVYGRQFMQIRKGRVIGFMVVTP